MVTADFTLSQGALSLSFISLLSVASLLTTSVWAWLIVGKAMLLTDTMFSSLFASPCLAKLLI